MRHVNFSIGRAERDAWFGHMSEAVTAAHLDPGDELEMLRYFANAATHMINTD
jgi:truncated hemoglobin YjbI